MKKLSIRCSAALMALMFSTATLAQAPAQTVGTLPVSPAQPQEEAEGKFVLGVLLKVAAPMALEWFAKWTLKKMEANYDGAAMGSLISNASASTIVKVKDFIGGSRVDPVTGIASNIVFASPTQGLAETQLGEGVTIADRYQGVHVALVKVDAYGKPLNFHALADGFTTGDRFKLRVLSTYDALVVLGNITPKGVHRQIYPAVGSDVVKISGGKEVLLPLGKNEYLQFVGDVGKDQITITIRDPRSLESDKASTAKVHRRDEVYGSNFVQEVIPGRYAVIAEAISIQHR